MVVDSRKKLMLLIWILSFSCKILEKSANIRYLEERICENQSFRKDGYYFCTDNTGKIKCRYFFYNNGKLLYAFACDKDLIKCENDFLDSNFRVLQKNNINWTNYVLKSDTIVLERIYPAQFYPHCYIYGRLISDSSFVLNKIEEIKGEYKDSLNDTFHFKHYLPKPDSLK